MTTNIAGVQRWKHWSKIGRDTACIERMVARQKDVEEVVKPALSSEHADVTNTDALPLILHGKVATGLWKPQGISALFDRKVAVVDI